MKGAVRLKKEFSSIERNTIKDLLISISTNSVQKEELQKSARGSPNHWFEIGDGIKECHSCCIQRGGGDSP